MRRRQEQRDPHATPHKVYWAFGGRKTVRRLLSRMRQGISHTGRYGFNA